MSYKICIIGDGLTALILTKVFLDLNIQVDLLNEKINKTKLNGNRTVAISKSNFEFLKNKKVLTNNPNYAWKINEIKLFSTKLDKLSKLILEFKNKNPFFYIVKNNSLYSDLKKNIKKKSLLKFLKKKDIKNFLNHNNNYNLVINCSNYNIINKKFFFKKIKKNYESIAFTTIIKHRKFLNHIASQYFTKIGPMAFLPISPGYTSVVWSIKSDYEKNNKLFNNQKIVDKIKEIFIKKEKIISFSKIKKFKLNFSIPRDYYKNNILVFGDALHQIHPLSGQGLNMTIRDIKTLREIIKKKISLGLDLDESALLDFNNKTKSYNFLFAKGNDFIEKYFSINNKTFNLFSERIFNNINKRTFIKDIFVQIADKGLNI